MCSLKVKMRYIYTCFQTPKIWRRSLVDSLGWISVRFLYACLKPKQAARDCPGYGQCVAWLYYKPKSSKLGRSNALTGGIMLPFFKMGVLFYSRFPILGYRWSAVIGWIGLDPGLIQRRWGESTSETVRPRQFTRHVLNYWGSQNWYTALRDSAVCSPRVVDFASNPRETHFESLWWERG